MVQGSPEVNAGSLLYSRSFSQARKETPKDSPSRNHQLLVQAGFIRQESAGIYTLLPFATRVLQKIEGMVRGEMDGLGAEEIVMPILHSGDVWHRTGRWDTVDVLYRLKSRWNNREYALAPTTEEIAAPLVAGRVKSYRDLPLAFYQIKEKFRDEKRAKSGMIRGREFRMKDMYSLHTSQDDFQQFYQEAQKAYLRIFGACGIDAKIVEASGGEYTKKSTHEFHAISDAGEDNILHCTSCTFAQNSEISDFKAGESCAKCGSGLEVATSIEIGHIFDLGDTFTKAFNATFVDKDGSDKYPVMGCYGIGTSRLIGTVVELHNDDKGIIWPKTVSPFGLHMVGLNLEIEEVRNAAFSMFEDLSKRGVSVLFDDRQDVTARDKFQAADLIGIPLRLVISSRGLQQDSVELKERISPNAQSVNTSELPQRVLSYLQS